MRFIWSAASHQGMVRQNNEDALYPDSAGESAEVVTLMVADGMGGHVAGEVASRLAVNAAAATDELSPADRVAAGNRAIREEVAREPSLEGMGTTMTLVTLDPAGKARFAHVGDSRAYHYRKGELRQVTQDHTVAAEYVSQGRIAPEEAASHPQRHMLTRTLGLTRFVNVDEIDLDLEAGDRILLCSDGLTEMVPDKLIGEVLDEKGVEEAAWRLIDLANAAGGLDNISVIVIEALD
ncbi:MAG TPA: PP2C family serine/threonine-protein phosphatase [Acidimicrobiia bacterium]